jgi:RimJ/RimL family protein N-acetyltransferase
MHLTLPGCTVRPWVEGDAPALVRHANNPRIAANLRDRFPHPYEAVHATTFLHWVRQQAVETVWAIDVGGDAVGGIGVELRADVERVSAEIGYWLSEEFWGRGIATSALSAVSPAVMRRFELTRLYALPFADNRQSIRVLEKAGYMLEGRLRHSAIKNGFIKDQLLYARYAD